VISLIRVILGGLCLVGGFVLISRGVGGHAAAGSVRFLGLEFKLSRVGPGVLFALFGVVLVLGSTSAFRGTDEEKSAQASTPSAAHDSEKTPPTPVINGVVNSAPVTTQINCVYIVSSSIANRSSEPAVTTTQCGVSGAQAKALALQNLRTASESLREVQSAKSDYFFPALTAFRSNPNKASWRVVVDEARTIRQLVQDAVVSLVHVDPAYADKLGPHLASVSKILVTRNETLSSLEDIKPFPSPEQTDQIEREQSFLYKNLQTELDSLIQLVSHET
jgi:hypothetical protein